MHARGATRNHAQYPQGASKQQLASVPRFAPCWHLLQKVSSVKRIFAATATIQHVLDQPQLALQQQCHIDQRVEQQHRHLQQQRWRSDRRQQRQDQRRLQLWGHNGTSFVQHSTPQLLADTAAAAVRIRDNAPYIPADTVAGRDRQLTAHIKKRRHWTQLQLIWLDNSTNFSPIHLTATMTKLARLVELQGVTAADRPELFKFSSAIMSSVHLLIDALDSRGAAQCLWAYAKLQSLSPHFSRSGAASADAIVIALQQQHMQQLQPQELSQVAWAAAVLSPAGLNTLPRFWRCLQDRLLLLLPDVKPPEVACFAWAAAKVHVQPPESVVTAVMQHAQDRMGEYRARELLQVLLAAAAWHHKPTVHWQEACLQRLQQLVPSMVAQDISHALLALARLQMQPPSVFLCALLQRLRLQLPAASRAVLVTVPYALAKLQVDPGAEWWAGFLPYTTVALQSLNPAGLSVLAWSLSRLNINPGQPWVDELLQQSGYKLGGFAAQELSMLVWALGRWQAAPSSSWWERFEHVSVARCEHFTAAELGALFNGIEGMMTSAYQAAAAAAGTAEERRHAQLPGLQQQQQQQQQFLSPTWSAKLLAAAQCDLSGAPAGCLAGIIMGLAKLAVRPSLAWMNDFEAAAAAALPEASIGNAAAILWAYAVLEVQPSRHFARLLNSRLCELLQAGRVATSYSGKNRMAATSAAATAAAGPRGVQDAEASATATEGQLTLQIAAAAGDELSPAAAGAANLLSPAVAAQLLWSFVHLPHASSLPWLDDLLQAVLPGLATNKSSSRTLVMLLWGLAKLEHKPGCKFWLDVWWAAYVSSLAVYDTAGGGGGLASNWQHLHRTADTVEFAPPSAAEACSMQQQQQQEEDSSADPHSAADSQAAADTSLSLVTAVLWSFCRLRSTPSTDSWLGVVLQVAEPLLPAVSGQALAALLRQLVMLKVWPGEVWLAAAADALLQKWRQQHSKRDVLLQALGCMYKLGYVPPTEEALKLKALVVAR